MFIKCWGSRGSISVSGKEYVSYGGDTTCIEVRAQSGDIVIVDAGTGIRRLGNSLLEQREKEYHLLFTHAHWDHIQGIAFFKPLFYSDVTIKIQDRMIGGLSTRDILDRVMKPPFFPIQLKDTKADIHFDKGLNQSFTIGSLSIETIPTSHSVDTLGYRFTENGKTFVFLTDNELGFDHPQSLGFDAYVDFARGADILFHDAEYTHREYEERTGWGHSSVADVMALARKADVGLLGLIHLNQDRRDDEMDQIVDQCNQQMATLGCRTQCAGIPADFEINL
ncbi:MAG: MBL fold metallo-hydrolase [Desulfobacterales bacterium]|nr:MBL fold metallo-hydrolase [Desulfobacterales bacterium]